MKIILASKSPRRLELLGGVYEQIEVVTAETDETLPNGTPPRQGVEILAVRKGRAVLPLVGDAFPVISSDTLVELDGIPLGKPENEKDACRMLRTLSGRTHNVHTGVAVHYRGRVLSGVASTSVRFHTLSDETVNNYVKSGEPMDKAGAYGIQGLGGALVEGYEGDFDTVVGLSLALTKRLMKEIGADE
jgi:septum formation protein